MSIGWALAYKPRKPQLDGAFLLQLGKHVPTKSDEICKISTLLEKSLDLKLSLLLDENPSS